MRRDYRRILLVSRRSSADAVVKSERMVMLIFQHYDNFESRYKGLLPLRSDYVREVIEGEQDKSTARKKPIILKMTYARRIVLSAAQSNAIELCVTCFVPKPVVE